MAKSYSGLDKTESFFAHYGRKGMKRGMNIFNPDYKPVGEKAKGQLQSKAVQAKMASGKDLQGKIMSGERKSKNKLAAKTVGKLEAPVKTEVKVIGSLSTPEPSNREKLLAAEKNRQSARSLNKTIEAEANAKKSAERNAMALASAASMASGAKAKKEYDDKAVKMLEEAAPLKNAIKLGYEKMQLTKGDVTTLSEAYSALLKGLFDMQEKNNPGVLDAETRKEVDRGIEVLNGKKDIDSLSTLEALAVQKMSLTPELANAKDTDEVKDVLEDLGADEATLEAYEKLLEFKEEYAKRQSVGG